MSYLDVLKNSPDQVFPGVSACQGCGAELILRRVLAIAGKNSIFAIPPGCMAGDGATADCGFQSMSATAERGEKMLYICYDYEGYMNTGYQRSSTTTRGSRTSTTPLGKVISGKPQEQKYVPLIMAMHNIEYCATASPSNMKDMVDRRWALLKRIAGE